jgi:hypothetical protein
MRKGFDDLHGMLQDRLGLEVRTGHLFIVNVGYPGKVTRSDNTPCG